MININKQLQIFNNEQFGKIRMVLINGEPHFVGKDVAEALEYNESHKAVVRHVEEEDRIKHPIPTNGGKQDFWVINESGLYSLIFGSKLEKAKAFKRWVTDEVLPSIRKTGSYNSKGVGLFESMQVELQNTRQEIEKLKKIVFKRQKQRIANKKYQLKIKEPLEVRLEKITSDMVNQILVNSLTTGLLRITDEGNVIDKEILFSEANKLNVSKHDIKIKLELLNKIIYKQVRINGKVMWCIVVNK